MVDITAKNNTHRIAIAQAVVKVGSSETLDAIQQKNVPKGDVLEAARVAGLFGIKKTSDLIPDCHPIPIEYAHFKFTLEGLNIFIEVEVQTIYKTGVEVEAMHGASIAALTMYDMLKPIDKNVEICNIRLLEKQGGKSDYRDKLQTDFKAAVIVCSDSVSSGKKEDTAGKTIVAALQKYEAKVGNYLIIPDEIPLIQKTVRDCCDSGHHLILITGGTGLSKRDHTPEAIRPILEREIPGIAETMRNYGQQRMPYAMLSRSVAGMIGEHLILALPGSTRGAAESMAAIFPAVFHLFRLRDGFRHENEKTGS
ncbi:MAG: bifunctional molybdenum cofactor biosynthesis protein MoaC/MoaB [Saprospiraceae bacterium]|nr:bifunctional molybdenum cofactor biosynthesis protein MoaC/MoaB [Saprospiraceae bacterium]